jgi:poly(hydroxyalkanoate) depolymerase family esterase
MKRAVALALAGAITAVSTAAFAGTVTVESYAGRNVRVFVPAKTASPTALVVLLHGCTQTAEAFADATQMDAVAEKDGFVVAYPEQSADTIATRCFQWYEPAHQSRDGGEPKELAAAADAVARAHGVDAERVYVGGLSAGAAMSVILGATYPDRFAAIGVIAGVEYKGATSIASAFSTSNNGGPSPEQQGDLAHTQMGTRARVVPTFVVHGTSDGVLAKINGDQVAAQWRRTNTLTMGDDAIEPVRSITGSAGYPFTRMVHRNKANGASVVEYYVVDGLGHAWPGGKDGGSYSDTRGPDASALLWAFFKGRTLSAPLDVPPVELPAAPGAGTDPGGSTDPSGNDDGANAASTSSSSDGGGCAIGRAPHEGAPRGLGAAMLLAAATLMAARRSSSRRVRRSRIAHALAYALVVGIAGGGALVLDGCGSDSTGGDGVGGDNEAGSASDAPQGSETGNGNSDAGPDAAKGTDGAACPTPKVLPDKGETCIGFGKGTPCDTACGLPAYGYVCFNGGPPGFAGCVQASTTGSFGDTYCCPENKCVPEPDQDKECKTAGKPHRFQCPPDVAPPAGCTAIDAGASAVENFTCCP